MTTTTRAESDHVVLARWAADCAEHVLPAFTAARPGDDHPAKAIEAAREWADGSLKVGLARAAAVSAHEAARSASDAAAVAAARAAGHAASVAHMCAHAQHTADFAMRSAAAAHPDDAQAGARERAWQLSLLPERLRERAFTLEAEQTGPQPIVPAV